MFPIQALKMRNPSTGGGGSTAPTPPTATYEYDYTGRPWISQAIGPSAIYVATADKTYVTWEAQCQFRHIKIAAYDHATGTWSTPMVIDSHVLEDDDHGMPALEILSDGRLVCFYGTHNGNQEWSISGQSGGVPTITSWTRQAAITGAYAYPKPVNIDSGSGAGTLYLFLRKNSGSNYTYALRKAAYTSGGAVSFGAEASLIDFDSGGTGARVYAMEVRKNSTNIEFCATRADSGDTTRQHVYYFRYIVSTGAIQNLTNSVSTASGSLPITLTTANSSYREKTSSGSNITGAVSWCRDSNGYLHILYGDDTTTPFDLKHNWHNGTAWQGETTVAATNYFSAAGYVNDWTLVPRGTSVDAYYSVNNNGGFTGYGGDDIGRKIWSGSWGSEVLVMEGDETTALGFPTAVRDADPDLRVLFTECSQDAIMESWGPHKRYFLGDSGYIEWPAPSDADAFKNILVLNFEGANNATSYSDDSGWKPRHAITFNGNAKLDTATAPPWGTSWLKLDGTGDYLTIPESRTSGLPDTGDWKIGGGDTVEVVFRLNATGATRYLVSNRDSPSDGFALAVDSTNKLVLVVWSGGTALVNITGTTTLTTGTTYKAGFKRTVSGWTLYLGGASEGTAGAALGGAGLTTLYIGRNPQSTTNDFNGWIKQVRWTKLAGRDLSIVPSADFPVN